MSQPEGQENLVMWARPLLTSQEGIKLLVDPSLGGNYDFDDLVRVASIASMCVHPEVTQRPFMGEVVQALKLIYKDGDKACEDCNSQREDSSAPDHDYRGEHCSDSSWWRGSTPRLTQGYASSLITMEYSSGPMQEIDRSHSTSNIVKHSRSGPIRTKKTQSLFYRLRGSMSEHGLLSRRFDMDGYWV
ncbi:Receptor-like serine/threonine-protein kinase ALE2 [Acorus gramineus]|uniref:Receptor-like serine/threonine-protein kinase ALE2 n=1 Tax=Acorus gramineus TaxID=55184 RepID=A0AAV9A8M6_ACOGR|nr:Receptor-like serine/threonine-protein kinase ALE2 [Acorus gramineus]